MGGSESTSPKWITDRKKMFDAKLTAYYAKYKEHLKKLGEVATADNPHMEIEKIKSSTVDGTRVLKKMEEEIKGILESINNKINGISNKVADDKTAIKKNNDMLERLRRTLEDQEKNILEKRTELESKKKQLGVGSNTNKYRKHILYLLIFFNIFLIVAIVFLLKGTGSSEGNGEANGEGEGETP